MHLVQNQPQADNVPNIYLLYLQQRWYYTGNKNVHTHLDVLDATCGSTQRGKIAPVLVLSLTRNHAGGAATSDKCQWEGNYNPDWRDCNDICMSERTNTQQGRQHRCCGWTMLNPEVQYITECGTCNPNDHTWRYPSSST